MTKYFFDWSVRSNNSLLWKNEKFSLTEKKFVKSSIFSDLFSKNVTFTKFLPKKRESNFRNIHTGTASKQQKFTLTSAFCRKKYVKSTHFYLCMLCTNFIIIYLNTFDISKPASRLQIKWSVGLLNIVDRSFTKFCINADENWSFDTLVLNLTKGMILHNKVESSLKLEWIQHSLSYNHLHLKSHEKIAIVKSTNIYDDEIMHKSIL